MTIPTHIAFIMDGNGRWAQARGLPRTAGHKKGADTVRTVLEHAQKRGVKVVTLFAFSSENWNRPAEEVETLIGLFRSYMKNDVRRLAEKNIRVSFIGDRSKFPADIVTRMNEVEAETKSFDAFHVVLALSYGSRDDMVAAARQLAARVAAGDLKPGDITAESFAGALSTHDIPDPDLIVRTSGEERISNFLLWELAYAELYFTPVAWPDFDEAELDKAIENFENRHRRFGKV